MKKIIKFEAEWCGPCKMLDKVLDKFKEKHPDVEIEHVDVDENVELTAEYSVRNVPTMVFFEDDKYTNRLIGSAPLSKIEELANVL